MALRHCLRRVFARSGAIVGVLATLGCSGIVAGTQIAPAATSNVTVSVTVLSATSISAASCGSVDATPIVYNGSNQLYLTGSDGSGTTRITNTTDQERAAVWSPDGSKIAFASTRGSNDDIYVMNADGTSPVRLTTAAGVDADPDWSADGSKIAFTSQRDGNSEIYVMNPDGSAQTRITNDPASDERPTWSPDGLSIAFDSNRSGNFDVYRMLSNGTGTQQLTTDPAADYRPEWSPDGSTLIFGSARLGALQVFRMSMSGAGQTPLTTGPSTNYFPAWSPDGSQIAFQSTRDGNGEIYRMQADGSQLFRITYEPGDDAHPDWRPASPSAINFGTMLPGTSAVTGRDCTITWGSSNNTSMLRVFQQDGSGTAMYRSSVGSLDAGFGTSGKVTTPIGSGEDHGTGGMAVQSDGKVVTAGTSETGANSDFAVARHNADGSPDTSFGTGGTVVTPIGAGSDTGAGGAAVQPDGKIVVAGTSHNGTDLDFAVVRYNTDGSLDTSFGTGGKVVTPVGPGNDAGAGGVAVQADGKIVMTGESQTGTGYDFAVVRYNSNGSLDTSFGTGGKVVTPIGAGNEFAQGGMAVQTDGKIIATGHSYNGTNYDIAVVRYKADGSLDTTFAAGGKAVTPIGAGDDIVNGGVVVQPNGDIVVAGDSSNGTNSDFAVVRYKPHGALDMGFGTGGKVVTPIGAGNDSVNGGVATQADGTIIVAGTSANGVNDDLAMVRYTADGSLDTSFGSGGKVVTAIGSGDDRGQGGITIVDGSVYVHGTTQAGATNDFVLVRFEAEAIADYLTGTSDWSAGTDGMFAACLRSISGSGVAATWAVGPGNACPAGNGAHWNPVPTSASGAGAKIAGAPVSGVTDATATLRFGLRTATNQPPGAYMTPLVFDVIAPHV